MNSFLGISRRPLFIGLRKYTQSSSPLSQINSTPSYLKSLYEMTLELVIGMPEECHYRASIENLIHERFLFFQSRYSDSFSNKKEDDEFDQHLRQLSLEDLVRDAEGELQLTEKMVKEWRPYQIHKKLSIPSDLWSSSPTQ